MNRRIGLSGYAVLGLAALTAAIGLEPSLRAQTPDAPAAAAVPLDPAEAEGIVFERQQVMLQLEKDSELLGLIVAGLAPREQLGPTARAIASGARDAEASFAEQVPGGRAKPEVWANRADYDGLLRNFVAKSEEMARLAEGGNLNGVIEVINDAMPCKQCHDLYREPKKSS